MDTKKNLFSGEIVKDDSLPLDDILTNIKSKKTEEVEPSDSDEAVIEAEYNNTPKIGDKPAEEELVDDSDDNLSPLDKLRRAKENSTTGMTLSNDELNKGTLGAVNGDMVNTPERQALFDKAVNNMDDELIKREHLTLIKQPLNDVDHAKALLEISSVKQDENGKWFMDYKNNHGEPMQPEFFRIREEGDGVFSKEMERAAKLQDNSEAAPAETDGNDTEVIDGEPNDGAKEPGEEMSEEKRKTVQILIDKTGFGANIEFTEEERNKLVEADMIKLNEVKVVDIRTILAKKSDKTFQDIVKTYDVGGSRTTICFPASGFRAQMKGLTYGEYADVTLSMENVKFDQYYKRLSIIYNKMTNISTGAFKDFEDFLKNFAYTDIPLALYGLYCSTEPEEVSLPLQCGNEDCGKSFDWKFAPRNLLKLDRCADTFLDKMKDIATSPAMSYDKIKEEAAVNQSKYVELPESKIICEMGIASAYDFIYNFIPLMDENTFKTAFGEDTNQVYMNNILLLTSVRSVYVPSDDGYVVCKGYKDILDALYRIAPSEIQMLAALTGKIQNKYDVVFSFGRVVCPHCQHITNNLDVGMDELVFQTYNRLMSTEIDLNNIQDL